MPLVIFTLHTYGSWLPDKPQGYVARGKGIQPPNPQLAAKYRQRMTQDAVFWTPDQQKVVVGAVVQRCQLRKWTPHAIATEPSHVHAVISWQDETPVELARRSLKFSISHELNHAFGKHRWLGRKGSNQLVKDNDHLKHLCDTYLPSHRGWRYDHRHGMIAPNQPPS